MPATTPGEHAALTIAGVVVTTAEAQPILDIADLAIPAGQLLGVAGPSGAGKTTLLAVLAGLLAPGHGQLRWGDEVVSAWSASRRDGWRRRHVGLVFQDFALIAEMSALDNVLLPARFVRTALSADLRRRALDLLDMVGIATPSRRAGLLSRGEQQRLAVARALLGQPSLLMADEPTASLDGASGAAVIELLCGWVRASGATLVAVSHDHRLLDACDRTLTLRRGTIATDSLQRGTSERDRA